MAGTVRSLIVVTAFVAACAEQPPAAAPPSANNAMQAPDGEPKGDDGPTTSKAAGASDEKAWPFTPQQTAEERKAQLDRLAKDGGPLKTNWVPPGKSLRYGHAEALIAAPYDAVKARLQDFTHYKDLAGPKFKKVSVVDKQAGKTDLYFQLPIMNGLVTIWYVTRFTPARPLKGGGDVIEGNFVKGNIKDMQIAFTLRPGPDANSTVAVCDLVVALNIPAPEVLLDEELRDACGDGLVAVRARTTAPPP